MLKKEFIHDDFDTYCYLYDNSETVVVAVAKCHPDEQEFHTNLTGENIAYLKAMEKYARAKANQAKQEGERLKQLREYLFPNKFFSDKVPEDTKYGVQMVQTRLDKKIKQYNEMYNKYKEIELETAMSLKSYIMSKSYLFKKIKEKQLKK